MFNVCLTTFLFQKHFSGAVDRIIRNELVVLCQLSEEGCEWSGCIADYQVWNLLLFFKYEFKRTMQKLFSFEYFNILWNHSLKKILPGVDFPHMFPPNIVFRSKYDIKIFYIFCLAPFRQRLSTQIILLPFYWMWYSIQKTFSNCTRIIVQRTRNNLSLLQRYHQIL